MLLSVSCNSPSGVMVASREEWAGSNNEPDDAVSTGPPPPSSTPFRSDESGFAPVHAADLRGAVQLATDGTLAATDLVEAVHARVLASIPFVRSASPRTQGLTGWIYRTVRTLMRLAGRGTEVGLHAAEQALPPASPSPPATRLRLQAILNGVMGDHLFDTGNPLAYPFSLRDATGAPVGNDASRDATPLPDTLVVFVHGLCCSDRSWTGKAERPGHVGAISNTTGGVPVFVRYNTGRPICANGALLARQLQSLVARRARPPRLVLVAHSMGGLVVQSAFAHARRTSARWPRLVTETIYLGTPHQGAPLERAGAWIEDQLRRTQFTAPFAALASLRSRGIQDLHDGASARSNSAFSVSTSGEADNEPGRSFYAAATLASSSSSARAMGDGLVPLASALDTPPDSVSDASTCPPTHLSTPLSTRQVFEDIGHFDLLHDPSVTEAVQTWLDDTPPSAPDRP